MKYKVTYPIDSLDTKPIIKFFDEHYEIDEWLDDEVQRRIGFEVEHSPFSISEIEYRQLQIYEYSLIKIEEI